MADDVEYSVDKSIGNHAPGSQKCMSLPCIILGYEMDKEADPVPPSV